MLIIAIATAPGGAVTHHLVRDETGAGAYQRLRPLLTPGSDIATMSIECWRETRGDLPRDSRALDEPTREEILEIKAAGGRLIDPLTPPPDPAA